MFVLPSESHPGVLTLNVGSEVILGCRGDITVDGVPLVTSIKHTERMERTGDLTSDRKAQKASRSPGVTGTDNTGSENFEYPGKAVTGINAEVTTANPPMSSAKVRMWGNGRVLRAGSQFIKPNSLSRITEEGGAFSVTMEMGLSTEKSTNTDYDDEDYEEMVEGLRVTRSIKRQARWTRNGQIMRNGAEHGGALRLPALRFTDSGNYSCYRRGKLVSSVKLSVGSKETHTLTYTHTVIL